MEVLSEMTLKDKKHLKKIKLAPVDTKPPAFLEVDEDMLEYVFQQEFVYEGTRRCKVDDMYNRDQGQKIFDAQLELLETVGFVNYSGYEFEYKTPPEPKE
jgi:hypothetical protein